MQTSFKFNLYTKMYINQSSSLVIQSYGNKRSFFFFKVNLLRNFYRLTFALPEQIFQLHC